MRLLLVPFCLALANSTLGQGSLTPPAGPAPLGKTLDQVEPRIDVQRTFNPLPTDFNNHVILNAPGSYYLTANLAVTKPNAISITASGVTLDLNGFQISRASGSGGSGVVLASGTAPLRSAERFHHRLFHGGAMPDGSPILPQRQS
jgi:hypothetical protein